MGQLPKWTKEITEVSANVWKVTMTHELGSKVEMTGIDLDQLEKEAEVSAIKMDEAIEEKIQSQNKDINPNEFK